MSGFELEQDFDMDEMEFDEIPLPSKGTHDAILAGIRAVKTGDEQRQSVVAEIRIEWENDIGETLSHVESKWFSIEKGRTAAETLRDRKEFCRMLGGEMLVEDGRHKIKGIGKLSEHVGKALKVKVKAGSGGDRIFLNDIRPNDGEEE